MVNHDGKMLCGLLFVFVSVCGENVVRDHINPMHSDALWLLNTPHLSNPLTRVE